MEAAADFRRLIDELQVCQIDLELQNVELRQAQLELEYSRDRFSDLYDFSPVGCVTFDAKSAILEANLSAAKLLGTPRPELKGKILTWFIAPGSRDAFRAHCREAFSGDKLKTCEAILQPAQGGPSTVQFQSTVAIDPASQTRVCRTALIDLTERMQAEKELRASHEQLRSLSAHLQAVREEERTRVAREIHDVLAQELTAINADAAWLSRRLAQPLQTQPQKALLAKLATLTASADAAVRSVQRIATELRPVVLDSLGLCAAIEWQAADFQTRTEIHCQADVPAEDIPMARDRSTAMFRILQESLTNVARHARATKVRVRLRQEADELILTVQDNGRGIRASELNDPRSLGLLGLRERALMLDGRCSITGRTGKGTIVEVRLPLRAVGQAAKQGS